MADKATISKGVKVSLASWSGASPETAPSSGSYTEYGQLIDVQLPNYDVKEVKATYLNQADIFERFKQGFVNAGELGFSIHFGKEEFALVLTDIAARAEKWFKVEIPEPDSETNLNKFEFHGFWKGIPVEIPNSESTDGITAKISVKVNGKPQFTAYS